MRIGSPVAAKAMALPLSHEGNAKARPSNALRMRSTLPLKPRLRPQQIDGHDAVTTQMRANRLIKRHGVERTGAGIFIEAIHQYQVISLVAVGDKLHAICYHYFEPHGVLRQLEELSCGGYYAGLYFQDGEFGQRVVAIQEFCQRSRT